MSVITKDFARFPFDGDTKKVLNSLGFNSVYDILNFEATCFYQQYDPLLNGNAVAIYQQAKDFVTLADQQLRRSDGTPQIVSSVTSPLSETATVVASVFADEPGGGSASGGETQNALTPAKRAQRARWQQPLYERLFSDDQSRFAPPGSLQSLDSPVSYLMHLLKLLYLKRQDGNSALQDLLARRPDLATLLLNEDAFKRALPTSELAGEILQNALTTLTEEKDIDHWLAFQPYPIRLPFDVARARIDLILSNASLTLGDAWSTLSKDYRQYGDKSTAALAWSGINTGLQELLIKPLNSNAQPYPSLFLLIDEQGQPTGEHLLALGQLWPGREIKDLDVKASEKITCRGSNAAEEITINSLTFARRNGDTASLQSATFDAQKKPKDNQLYRGTVTLTVTAKQQSGSQQLEERHIQAGILVGNNLSSHAVSGLFTAEQQALGSVLGAEIGSVAAAQMTIPVDMLCQETGINRQQLQEAFALGDHAPEPSPWLKWDNTKSLVNGGVYGARFLWGTAASLVGDEPGNIKDDELNTTPFQLDRLQKLIRLQQVSALPYDQLDNLLQNAIDAQKNAADISPGTLGALGVYQRYARAYKLDAEQFAALFGLIPYCARAGKKSLLDRLLAVGRSQHTDADNTDTHTIPKFNLTSQGPFSGKDLTLLAAAFDTSVDTLKLLKESYKSQANYEVWRGLEGITALYRPVLLAKSFSVSVETLLLLIEQISGKAGLQLLAQPAIATATGTHGRDSIDLLITLDEAVRWGQRQARDLNALMAPLRDHAEKTKTFSEAFAELWHTLYLTKKEQRDNALREENQRKKARGEPALSEEELQKKLNEPVQMPKPGELVNTLKNQANAQNKPGAANAGQDLTPLVMLLSQQFHLEPGIAWSLLFNYAGVLDSLAGKITDFLNALISNNEPGSLKNASILLKNIITLKDDPNNLIPTFKPLLLAASVFSNAHLDEVALTPWRNGKLPLDTSLPLWQQMLWLYDFNDLAQGDERVRPVLLSEAEDWQERLAKGYETDAETVKTIVGDHYDLSAHHQLHRMAEFSHASGWSVTDLDGLVTQKSITRDTWQDYFAFSLRGGTKEETDASVLAAQLGEKRNSALLAAYKSQCRRLTISDEGKHWENAWAEHEPDTADVADRLLIDPEITAKVPTTRIGEATASVQAYIQCIADGREPQWYMNEGELKNWHENDRYYAIWAANQQLRWHPDQYINPVSRLKKTPPFREFENQLSQSRLDKDSINDALSGYLTLFEQVVNLSTIGAYQDGMSSTQSTIYFLGRSPHAPFSYYYRTWGKDSSGLRLWSSWQKINLPTTQNVLTQAPPGDEWNNYRKQQQDRDWMPVQARLLIFAGRVSFIWVETRTLTESRRSEDKKSINAEKRYQHVISLVYQRINGEWSTPIELYKSQPCLPGMPVKVPDPGKSVFYIEADASYLDPLPHLAAFVLPREVAEKNLFSIKNKDKDEIHPYYNQQEAITSDLLAVALYSTFSDPAQTNASSKLWLFDEDLVELLPMARWEQLSKQAEYEGMNLTKVKELEANKNNTLLTTISDLVNNSYLCTPAESSHDKKKPSEQKYQGIYFTRVLTPCIPDHWLFNQRRLLSRSEPVFGTQLDLTLSVGSSTAGQTGLDSYQVSSVLQLTAEQWQHVPADKKLVHFLCFKGQTVRQMLTSKESTLPLTTFYPSGSLDAGEARHGVVLAAKSDSDIVSMEPSANAWIESGQLAVLHQPLTTVAAEIRETVQGAQYLYLNDIEQPDTLNSPGHTIHGRTDPDIHQTATTIDGVYNTLMPGVEKPEAIDVKELDKQNNWMPLTFVQGERGTGLSQWTYDITPEQLKSSSAAWLVTKVDDTSIRNALKKGLKMPGGATVCQVKGGKLAPVDEPGKIAEAEPVYLLTKIIVPQNEQSFTQACQIVTQPKNPLFTAITFKFYRVTKERDNNKSITLANTGLRIVSQQELDADLTHLTKTTLFTQADWGWISPTFLTTRLPYQLNRTYRLQSSACHYLLLKVAESAFSKDKAFSVSVQSMLNMQNMAGCKVIGLKKTGNQAEEITLSAHHITSQNNMLSLENKDLSELLKAYSYLFFALPWTASAMADVANYGLRFQLDGLESNTPLYGYIPCEIPSLSDAVITSSCTPAHAAVGETVTIQADIKLGPNMNQAVRVEVALNAAYQWAPGVSTLAGAQIKNDGTLTLTLPAGQRTVNLTLSVYILNAIGNVLPLATLTVTDDYSARRVMLAQPQIEHQHSVQTEWDWYFGGDINNLTRSSALQPISASQLNSKVVLTTLRIAPSSPDTPITATLKLPQGMTIATDVKTNLQALKAAKEKAATATQEEKEWLAGIALITTFLDGSSPKTGSLELIKSISLKQPVILPLPLTVSKEMKFIDSLTATVKFGPAETDVWWRRSYPMAAAATNQAKTLAISASSSQPRVMKTEAEESINCNFGDSVRLTLLLEAIKEATVSEVSLALPAKLSFTDGPILAIRLSAEGVQEGDAVSLSAVASGDAEKDKYAVTVPLSLTLKKGERWQLDVRVVAVPNQLTPDSGKVIFLVKSGAEEIKSNAISMGALYLPGYASVVPRFNDGTVIPAGTPLAVGTRFNYLVSFAMDANALQQQLEDVKNKAVPGPRLSFQLPGVVSVDSDKVKPGDALPTDLPLLSQEQAKEAMGGNSIPDQQNYGLHVANNRRRVFAQTVINPGSNIRGEFQVPVIVEKEGSSIFPTLKVEAHNSAFTANPKWKVINNPLPYHPPALSAYDTGRLPFIDLNFRRHGREGFDLPLPENTPSLLASKQREKQPVTTRYVRLNNQFGQTLVRTARYNPLAVLRAATQDHPLPALSPDGKPQPLEQDIANQIYFWELFYHVPALIAFRLNQDGRYEEAQAWLHHLFHPTFTEKDQHPDSVWHCRLLTTSYSYVSLDQASGPVDPDVIASVRPEFYRRATFFAYVKNLLDNGDSYYRSQSRDGFNKAWQCYLKVAHLLGAGEQNSQIPPWKPLTIETAINTLVSSGTPDSLFALPRSHTYQNLVDKLQQRLFNMRHGLTLDGSPMSLPLYDPPLDPAQLLAARSQGSAGSLRALAMQQSAPLPIFRYSTLYARANAAVDTLIQFGNTLLSCLNVQKDMEYQSLLIKQQQEMSNFVLSQQQLALQMNQQARQSLIIARNAAQQKLRDLDSWIEKDISDQESKALSLRLASSVLVASSSGIRAVGAGLDMAPNIFGFADGGMRWGAISMAISDGMWAAASGMDGAALQIETREMYRHRKEEWQQQRADTEASLRQLDVRLEVDTRQQENLERQLAQTRAQLGQFEQQMGFISTRFTNQLLYQWLVGQLSALYYQVYDIAAGLCQQTLTAWQYEVGNYSEQSTQFFKNSGWGDAQRGLLSGEHLRLGLLQLDKAYLSQTERMLEIRHTVSLKSLWLNQTSGPVYDAGKKAEVSTSDVNKKAAAGRAAREKAVEEQWKKTMHVEEDKAELIITIPVTEDLLAQRYPGHYQRQVLDISVTLPCLIGPHEEVCAMLTQQDNRFAIDPQVTYTQMKNGSADAAGKILSNNRPHQAIALSSGLEDNGIVLNFNDDKYRPFEGNGVVGTWCLTIPNPEGEMQKRMLETLNDIILTFHYRAKEGGPDRAAKVLKALDEERKQPGK